MSQGIHFAGKHGRADVMHRNGLWRVFFDGRADWYVSKWAACQVAIGLAHGGKAPVHIASLLDLSTRERRMS
jgi:hypothetical protein